jgi:hypothetical protein
MRNLSAEEMLMVAGGETKGKVEGSATIVFGSPKKGLGAEATVKGSLETDFKGDAPGGLVGDLAKEGATLTGGGAGFVSYNSPGVAFGAGSAGK